MSSRRKPYMNPYLAGIGLGFVLLLTFIVIGRGIGVSGAMSKISNTSLDYAASVITEPNNYINQQSLRNKTVLDYWILIEVIGIFIGGYLSSLFANRKEKTVIKGQQISISQRYTYALIGGILMGIGSRIARGCTSGQALTGGALLNMGSWVFMISIFIGGFLLARYMKRAWT